MQRLIDKDTLKDALIDCTPYVMDPAYRNTNSNIDMFTVMDILDEQPTVNEWISVDERLPEEHEEEEDIFDPETLAVIDVERHNVSQLVIVAVTREDGERFVSDDMTIDGKWVNYSRDYLAYDYKVTHWMPMPQPPKEETNET